MLGIYAKCIFQSLLVLLPNLCHRSKKLFRVGVQEYKQSLYGINIMVLFTKWKRLLSSNDQMFTLLGLSYSKND